MAIPIPPNLLTSPIGAPSMKIPGAHPPRIGRTPDRSPGGTFPVSCPFTITWRRCRTLSPNMYSKDLRTRFTTMRSKPLRRYQYAKKRNAKKARMRKSYVSETLVGQFLGYISHIKLHYGWMFSLIHGERLPEVYTDGFTTGRAI